jgi:hypothetical protein
MDIPPALVEWLGTTAVAGCLASGVFWLQKELLSNRIRAAIDHEYAVKEKRLEATLQGELEGVRAGYQKALEENQIRFSKLHAEQADVIKELYRRLADSHSKLIELTAFLKPAPKEEAERRDAEIAKAYSELHNEAWQYYLRNVVMLPSRLCDKIEKFHIVAKEVYIDYTLYDGHASVGAPAAEKWKVKNDATVKARKDLRELLDNIANEFRKLLGMKSDENSAE